MSRAVFWVVKAVVEDPEHPGTLVDIYLSKAAAKPTGRPWTTKQHKAFRFYDRELLTDEFLRALRLRSVSIETAEQLDLRIVPVVPKHRTAPRHLDRAKHAA